MWCSAASSSNGDSSSPSPSTTVVASAWNQGRSLAEAIAVEQGRERERKEKNQRRSESRDDENSTNVVELFKHGNEERDARSHDEKGVVIKPNHVRKISSSSAPVLFGIEERLAMSRAVGHLDLGEVEPKQSPLQLYGIMERKKQTLYVLFCYVLVIIFHANLWIAFRH